MQKTVIPLLFTEKPTYIPKNATSISLSLLKYLEGLKRNKIQLLICTPLY